MSARVHDVYSRLFMVRVWPEDLEEGRVEWRGKVQCVSSGETLYFRDWEAMLTFIRDSSNQRRDTVGGQAGGDEEGRK